MTTRAYIGLGSNLDHPAAQVRRALEALAALPDCRLQAHSSLYRSAPLGPPDQPDYVNAVAALDTDLDPHALLHALQGIETSQGRVRGVQRWGPRTLDLDLLIYGDAMIDDAELAVPHPGLPVRAFVLYPLMEIAPQLIVPGLGSLQELVARCPRDGLARLVDSHD